MSYQQQTIQERYGNPPPMREKARLRICDLCSQNGKRIYLYWGDTGVPKKNDPTKNVVLPVEHESGQWHECPYREAFNPQGSGGNNNTITVTTTPIPQPQPRAQVQGQQQAQAINAEVGHVIITWMQSLNDQNKQIIQYMQTLVASNNHAVEYLETIANSLKAGPQRLLGASFDNVNTGEITSSTFDTNDAPASGSNTINLAGSKEEDEDARIEKEYKEYKEKFG